MHGGCLHQGSHPDLGNISVLATDGQLTPITSPFFLCSAPREAGSSWLIFVITLFLVSIKGRIVMVVLLMMVVVVMMGMVMVVLILMVMMMVVVVMMGVVMMPIITLQHDITFK